MANPYFQFKQFTVQQDRCAMKVTTDGCLFGAWLSKQVKKDIAASSNNCLDIGTGTGLLSLMLAQQTAVTIDAIEIDKSAAEQAKANVAASPWQEFIRVIATDVKNFQFQKKYEVIFSSPPFYENELKAPSLQKNIAHHQDGLLLSSLLTIIRQQLLPLGSFYLLLPCKREKEARELLLANKLALQELVRVRQSVDHDFFRIMLKGRIDTGKKIETATEEIAIKDAQGEYTPAFIALLKEYYLYL